MRKTKPTPSSCSKLLRNTASAKSMKCTNVTFFNFHRRQSRQQEPGESFDTFVGDLRRLVKSCGYGNVEDSTYCSRSPCSGISATTRPGRNYFKRANPAWRKRFISVSRREITTRQLKSMTWLVEVHIFDKNLEHQERERKVDIGETLHEFAKTTMLDKSPRRCRYCNQLHARSVGHSNYAQHMNKYVQNVQNEIILPSCVNLNRMMHVNTWLKNG